MPWRRLWAIERGTLWAMDLNGEAPAAPAPQVAATIGEVPADGTESLAAAMGLADLNLVRQRFAAGRRCFAAWVAREILAYGWVSQSEQSVGELERSFYLPPDAAYIWDCATLPPFRRQGLYSALLRYIATTLRAEGIRWLWIGASLDNRPSILGFASAGFQPVLNLSYTRLVAVRRTRLIVDSTAPASLVAEARQVLRGPDMRAAKSAVPRVAGSRRSTGGGGATGR